MEKISRILPPNARTGTYDASRALPGRPGAPKLGRPEPMESVVDRVTLSDQITNSALDAGPSEMPMQNSKLAASQYKSGDLAKAQLVKDLSSRFFAKNSTPKQIAQEGNQAHSEEVVSRALEATESSVSPDSSSELSL